VNLWISFFKMPCARQDVFFEWTQADFDRCRGLLADSYTIWKVELDK